MKQLFIKAIALAWVFLLALIIVCSFAGCASTPTPGVQIYQPQYGHIMRLPGNNQPPPPAQRMPIYPGSGGAEFLPLCAPR